MKQVFCSNNSVEAHVISHRLEQAGIAANISGDYLSAGRGALPAMNQTTVWVVNNDEYDDETALIKSWGDENNA